MPYIPIMPKLRIIPTLALLAITTMLAARWVGAQTPPAAAPAPPTAPAQSAAPAAPPTEAEKLIDEAVKKIAALNSIAAEIEEQVDMLGQHFMVKGKYLKAPDYRVYLRLQVSGLTDSKGTLLQVCDGNTLWDFRQVLDSQNYFKTGKIPQIMQKMNSAGFDPELREKAVSSMGMTGPEVLLTGLRKAIKFDQQEEDTFGNKPVWVLHGFWTSREGLVGPNQQPLHPFANLPAYIPSVVTLWLDKESGWPLKVLLVGKAPSVLEDTRPIGPDGKRIGPKAKAPKIQPSRIEMVYLNVKLNPTLKVEEFAFEPPPDARVDDNTEAVLSQLEQAIQLQAAQKKEAAKKSEGDEPVLSEGIKPPPAPAAK